jgi:glutaminyl-peptide cyclotransferase
MITIRPAIPKAKSAIRAAREPKSRYNQPRLLRKQMMRISLMRTMFGGLLIVIAALLAVGAWRSSFHSSSPIIDETAIQEQRRTREQFAADRGAGPMVINQERTMEYLKEICKIGPRMSGTEGMKKQQEYMRKHFEKLGGKVTMQNFTGVQNGKPPVEMANMIVSWGPDTDRRIILCSHYDTRPIADQEPNPRDWDKTFLSANDGGSGVALLMEWANHMHDFKPPVGIDFVFFDGEEYVFKKADKYFLGSEHFAQAYRDNPPKFKYRAAVLLDMIGGKDAQFPIEGNSWMEARQLVEAIWKIGLTENCPAFQNRIGDTVLDDHLALNRVGIPAIDIIDFSYPHWHRLTDTPENCSAESLAQVAKVLSIWILQLK